MTLQQLRGEALVRVQSDAAHHLPLGYREAIWHEFGPRLPGQWPPPEGQLIRASLAILSVLKVLPMWERRFADNALPISALKTAGSLLRGELGRSDAQAVLTELWDRAVEIASEAPYPEVAVAFGAVQALSAAIVDEFFDPNKLDLQRDDIDDPEQIDASAYAAAAQAGGMPSDETSDSQARLRFWTWWLGDCIDQALRRNVIQEVR